MCILCLYEIEDPAKIGSYSLSVSIHIIFLNYIILKWEFFYIHQLSNFIIQFLLDLLEKFY